MPLLANFIATLFAGLIDWAVAFLGKRVGTAVTLFGFAATAGVTFWATTNALISALVPSMPSIVATSSTWIVPAHFNACVAAVIGTEFAGGVYRWAKTVALASAVN